MINLDISAFKSAKAAERKEWAIIAYDEAMNSPDFAEWRQIAEMLRLTIPTTRKSAAAQIDTEQTVSLWAPYADYALPSPFKSKSPSDIVTVQFSCGRIVRVPCPSLQNKPLNIGRALRVAIVFYRARIARQWGSKQHEFGDHVDVPAIDSCVSDSGIKFDPTECSAKTADLRAGTFNLTAILLDVHSRDLTWDEANRFEQDHAENVVVRYFLETAPKSEEDKAEEDERRDNYRKVAKFHRKLMHTTGIARIHLAA